MNRPKEQHIIPRVYLSYFKIDIESTDEKVVIIDTKSEYKIKPKSVPLNSTFFKKYEYYNSDDFVEEGYGLEVYLGKIENEYHKIMTDINNKVNLSQSIRIKLLEFLISAKLRSPIWRSDAYRHRLEMKSFMLNYYYGHVDFNNSEEELKKQHLSKWLDGENFHELLVILLTKKWYIYESKSDNAFITSDNPGFSIAWDKKSKTPNPYWDYLKVDSVIFFPLSPKYCLVIDPFESGTDVSINALDVPIEYEQAEDKLIDFINIRTFATRDKLIISDSKLFFERLNFED